MGKPLRSTGYTRRVAIAAIIALATTTSSASPLLPGVSAFQTPNTQWKHHRPVNNKAATPSTLLRVASNNNNKNNNNDDFSVGRGSDNIVNEASSSSIIITPSPQSRRSILRTGLLSASAALSTFHNNDAANAAVGTLPEYSDTNAILQGLTIDVTDKKQLDDTIEFFTKGFEGMKVLRERGGSGGGVVKDIWLGFGPETLSIPSNFELPVSSLSQYGGHASLHIRYDPFATTPLYKRSAGEFNNEPASGDSIAYLQLGVPQYRISQMVKSGGNVLDAYGWVNVVSPAGLPVRGIVGIRADPMMFLAVNCVDVAKSEEFYAKLGFVRQEYPYARLNKGQGQFEPPQPPKSVYVAPSPNSMGILLLQNKNRKKAIVPNPVLRSLNVVYAPSEGAEESSSSASVSLEPAAVDPSSIPVSFVPVDYLEKDIKASSVPLSLEE